MAEVALLWCFYEHLVSRSNSKDIIFLLRLLDFEAAMQFTKFIVSFSLLTMHYSASDFAVAWLYGGVYGVIGLVTLVCIVWAMFDYLLLG